MQVQKNPLLEASTAAVDMAEIFAGRPAQVRSRGGARKKELRKLTRKETAAQAVAGLTNDMDIFGFTRGQFSLIELLEAVLGITGPAHIFLSTWTAAAADLTEVLQFLKTGKVLSAKFLIDFSFQRRQPEVAESIRQKFGADAIRVTKNHAKFFLVENAGWGLTCKTSMNLNTNPRFEDFDLSNDSALFAFMKDITNDIFKKHDSHKQRTGKPDAKPGINGFFTVRDTFGGGQNNADNQGDFENFAEDNNGAG